MKKKREKIQGALIDRTTVKVRFSEVDAMQVVWHGEYIRYFEDGRESFGKHYGLEYLDIFSKGYIVPLVDITCQYKSPLTIGDEVIIETHYIPTDAAKIMFHYILYRKSDEQIVATGSSVQVFLNVNKELELINPPFYQQWKEKWNIV